MKFAEHLSAHITPEWRKQYINYEEMKAMLYLAVEEAPSAESVEPEVLTRHFRNFDEHFLHYCEKELKKIDTFYCEKLAEATRKFATLQAELKTSLAEAGSKHKLTHSKQATIAFKKPNVPARKYQELKLAFSEFYLSLILLQNYQTLNHTGFRKILKKHDKLLNVDIGARWRAENVDIARFHTSPEIGRLIAETEATVTNELEAGDRQKAMKRLRVPPLGEQQSPWTTFKVGLFSGSFIVLFIAVVLSAIFHDGNLDNLKIAFRLYRGPLLIVEFVFLMGINVYGWRSSGVNHVLIFELDPRNHLSEQHLMELAAVFGVVWTLSLLSFLYSASLSIPQFVNPLALTVIMIVFVLNPFKVFRHEARFWLLRICGRMFGAPFFHVGFADFWLADQLNSLVSALLDLHFLICFYITNPDWNYTEAEYPNKMDNPFLYCWLVASTIGSLYAYTWDIKMDWGLFDKSAGENKYLREEIVYSSTGFYYFAIVEDFVIRFLWAPSYVLVSGGYISGDLATSILAILEVFRRFVWNFFRLENEHLNNCGKFRAVRDISVAPVDSSDHSQILRMMDDEDGVINRKPRKYKKKEDKRPLLKDDPTVVILPNENQVTFKESPES
ncbi:xenotropic and polytropic retrovirus receptor 1 homolog isoform X3 [Chrysoperla carnea]|uniref:xenotropic and polytropic retrovirus receptor 1 homolog isoform X3 n=1 Tax=Chrysoperla carnea TaxID=189513 RepID=UPI001D07C5A5|nr:xenotropic and polytropic retrovirus receptor 1 homolog isoform X3 [Chrysoperla carnea]